MSLTTRDADTIAKEARAASISLQAVSGENRNAALERVLQELKASKDAILEANRQDVHVSFKSFSRINKKEAETFASKGKLSRSLIKRLDLSATNKFESMLQGIVDVQNLQDPVNKMSLHRQLDDGLVLRRMSCPIGVLLVIFEARPEVIINITALALKSGNAAILKGGKESVRSFAAISNVVSKALEATIVPPSAIQLVSSREDIDNLLNEDKYIDLVIPRGGQDLVRYIKSHTRIPVLGHADGLCSVYLDEHASQDVAVSVTVDSKIQYPAACNAAETLLVNSAVKSTIFPKVAAALIQKNVHIRCDALAFAELKSHKELADSPFIEEASPEDFDTEFLDLDIAVKVVDSLEDAVQHINEHGSKHTDCIITSSQEAAETFMTRVDAAGVYHNCSTRFADGYRYGFGTEVGISTNKIHSRGPVGLEGLMIYKYKLQGSGQTVKEYNDGTRVFQHRNLD